jgi:hypothetical protein
MPTRAVVVHSYTQIFYNLLFSQNERINSNE